jgi:DNA polymerase III subunit epsilon
MPSQLDMFSPEMLADPMDATARRQRRPMSETDMLAALQSSGRYRILKKLEPLPIALAPRPEFPLRGLIIDTETTGLDHRSDEIIEIGAVAFSFDDIGGIGEVIGVYGGLRQPGIAIPAEITRLTGITDDMVRGQAIDLDALRALVQPADLIIAHNAGFDRPFAESFADMFAAKAWACSVKEVDWSGRGFEGTKLGYLIGQSGYFHEGHRAVDDCFALLTVLSDARPGASGTAFSELYGSSLKARIRIYAEQSPFDMKDHLKARGYRWSDGSDGRPKSWWTEVAEEALDDEMHFLRTEIYRWPDADPPTRRLTAHDRFKSRR